MPRLDNKTESTQSFLSALDFGIEVFKEKIPENGEDSYLYSLNRSAGIVGVFDGCGGSGAKKYEKLKGKTGAYLASRIASGAAKDWFEDITAGGISTLPKDPEQLKNKIKSYLELCKDVGGSTTTFKGSMSKDFPTTAAVILTMVRQNAIQVTCIWAGDSRCYLLDDSGLKQLTEDDLGGLDAMENLTADGVLTNVITSSKDFVLHQKAITISKPVLLFAATDGCFGYFSTPMEFEYLLLSTLFSSDSIVSWEGEISQVLQDIAGDDFSLSGMCLGFGSITNLKTILGKRYTELFNTYIADLKDKTQEEKLNLWRSYKPNYTEFLNEG